MTGAPVSPMRDRFFDWLAKHPLVLWTLILIVVITNVWFDFRNPFWAIFDLVFLVVIGLVVILKH